MNIATPQAQITRAKPAGAFNEETVLEVRHWTDRLFSFRTTRDPAFRFDAGQDRIVGGLLAGVQG